MSSSTTALVAPEHLLEEVELGGHCAQHGEEKRKEELLTHRALCRRDSKRKKKQELGQITQGLLFAITQS